MAWIELTPEKLQQLMAGPEYASVTTAAKSSGQDAAGMVQDVLARVVQTARGYIGVKYQLGPVGTVPDEVEAACLAMARLDVLTRLPGLKNLLTKERNDAAKDGLALLKAVGRGSFAIVESTDPATDQPAVPTIAIVSKRTPKQTHDGLKRLFTLAAALTLLSSCQTARNYFDLWFIVPVNPFPPVSAQTQH